MANRLAGAIHAAFVVAAAAAALCVANSASAQRPTQRPTQRPADQASWKSSWSLQLASIYDDNAFRLSPGQQRTLANGSPQFANMNEPHDVISALDVGARFRRSGAGSERLELGLGVRADVYTFSRRHTAVELTTSASQDLSARDRLGVEVSYIPSEFRRNYLIGSDAGGSLLYEAGVASTLGGKLQYDRQLLRSQGKPELDFDVALLGGRREFKDFTWRDRLELGGRVRTDLKSGPLGLDLRVLRLRAMHSGDPEPVATLAGVSFLSLQRDFDETELGSEISIRTGKRTRMALIYERRLRDYVATLSEDPVYGDRRDTRNTVGGELRFDIRQRTALVVGGSFERQTSFRPGSGDTDAEEDYERFRTFLRLEYGR